MHHENEVKLIAYQIWEQDGHPGGHDLEHWFKAEAVWQKRQGQIEHMAEDLFSRTELPAPMVSRERKQTEIPRRRSK